MSAATARLNSVPTGFLAGCDRLVRPDVRSPELRSRQARLAAVLLAAPFAAGIALALMPLAATGVATLLAIPSAAAAVTWGLALLISLTGRSLAAERAAVAVAIIASVLAISVFGTRSPMVLLPLALGFETYWVGRDRRAAMVGAAVAAFGLFGGVAASAALDLPGAPGGLAQWAVPFAYLAFSWPRMRAMATGDASTDGGAAESDLPDRLGLALVRLARTGDIAAATPAAAQTIGLPAELLAGTSLFDRIHVADRVAFLSALTEVQRGGEGSSHEIRIRVAASDRPGSRYVPFAIDFARGDGAGEALLMIRDLTALTEAREALRQALAAREEIETAKSRFLAAVSHELRTPLNSIIGFSDMMIHGIAGELADQRQRDYVELIRQSGAHLLSVVNAILDVSKIESGAYGIRPEPFAVREAVEFSRSMVAQQAREKRLSLRAEVAQGVGEICADRRAVQQIMLNLLTNAIKFTPAGGHVQIEAQRRGGSLRIAVCDDGIGIAEQDLSRLGQPFTQVRNDFTRQYDGAGLGLSLVKGLVRLHEGEMTIESAPGEGTTVTVLLPVDGPRGEHADWGDASERKPGAVAGNVGELDEEIRQTA